MKNKTLPYICNQNEYSKIGDFLVCRNIVPKDYPLHQHDFYEFEYITDGEGIHTVNDKSYEIKKGDLIFITPMDFHGFKTKNLKPVTCHFYAKDLSPEISEMLSKLGACVIKNADNKIVEKFEYLLKIFEADGNYAELQLKNLTELIIIELFENKAEIKHSAPLNDNISQAIGYININFKSEITLDTISKKFHISPSYFSREFKKRTGVCFNTYLADKRFTYAKKLLKNGNRVIDACLESGFGCVRNFTKRFKKLYGITPTEYVKQQNNS